MKLTQVKIKQIKLLQQEYRNSKNKSELLDNNINDKIITFMLENLPKEINLSWDLFRKINNEYIWQILVKKFMMI